MNTAFILFYACNSQKLRGRDEKIELFTILSY